MNRDRLLLLVIVVLAATLRFYRLDAQSFWNDEGTSARVAERSLPLITAAAIGDIHPPLYYYALHFWRGLWGESEFALRGLSAALGVLLVWLIYLLGRQLLDEPTALVAALIAAVNPFQVYYSQEARMYVMLAVWSAASTCLLLVWLKSFSMCGALAKCVAPLGYVLTTAAGMYTHYAFPFVLVVHNLIVIAWLVAQRARWLPRLLTWCALQIAVGALYLPWLGVALQRLPEWKSPAPPYQLGPALLDTFRWFVFGRTIPTASVTVALGVVALFVLTALLPRRITYYVSRITDHPPLSTLHPLHSPFLLFICWLIPVALVLALGLYKEDYMKFLLVSSPAFCLLLGRGMLTAWRAARDAALPARLLIVLLLALAATFTAQSLSNLYFDSLYARDNYRAVAQRIERDARAGDAILLEASNQWETFTYYHRDDSNVIPLGLIRPVTAEMAAGELVSITARYKRLFVLYWAETEPDPNRYVERWLNANTYKVSEAYWGKVRLAVYAVPIAMSNRPDHALDVQFGDAIRLLGYSLMGDTVAPGDIIQLALFWQAQAPIATRYKVFVHLLDADDRPPVAQVDREPGGELVPTTIWQPGQTIIDRYGLAIPEEAAPGRYRIAVGLYDFDNQRLYAWDARRGVSIGDRVILTEIVVAR